MGRNIFQSEAPIAMIKAVRKVVHENMKPEQAYELYLAHANLKKQKDKQSKLIQNKITTETQRSQRRVYGKKNSGFVSVSSVSLW